MALSPCSLSPPLCAPSLMGPHSILTPAISYRAQPGPASIQPPTPTPLDPHTSPGITRKHLRFLSSAQFCPYPIQPPCHYVVLGHFKLSFTAYVITLAIGSFPPLSVPLFYLLLPGPSSSSPNTWQLRNPSRVHTRLWLYVQSLPAQCQSLSLSHSPASVSHGS